MYVVSDTICGVDDSEELFSYNSGGSATSLDAALIGGVIAGAIILFLILLGLFVRHLVPHHVDVAYSFQPFGNIY